MKRTALLLSAACLLFSSSIASAHEFLIKPEYWETYSAGQKLPLSIHSTHVFIKGEEIEDPKTVRVSYGGQAVPLTPNEACLTQDGSITLADGGAALIEGHRLPILWSETPSGGAEGGRSTHKDALSAGMYEKFAKLLLPVNGKTTGFDTVCGHRLEIVPIDNPLTAKPGDELSFRVLLNGKPAAFDTVEAGYDGFTDIAGGWAFSAAPVRHGEARVKVSAPGLWVVRVAVTVPEKTAEYDEQILRAVLMFPVR